jgi:hypothetical protein
MSQFEKQKPEASKKNNAPLQFVQEIGIPKIKLWFESSNYNLP